jgi:hypothetical protein
MLRSGVVRTDGFGSPRPWRLRSRRLGRAWARVMISTLIVFVNLAAVRAVPSSAAVSFVRHVGTASCGATSDTVTVSAAGVSKGHTLVIRFLYRGTSTGAVTATDSRANIYTVDADAPGSGVRSIVLSAYVSTALVPNDTITLYHPSGDATAVMIDEFSGIASTDRVDATATASGWSTTPSASVTTVTANDVLIGSVVTPNHPPFTEAGGWTSLSGVNTSCGRGVSGNATNHGAFQVTSTAGTHTYAPTMSDEIWAEAVVAYKPSSPTPPTLTATNPASPANDNNPLVQGTAEAGSTISLYTNATCTSGVAATGSAATLASPGLAVTVADNTSTTFYATATNAAGDTSTCSSSMVTYVEDSAAPPAPTLTSGPGPSGSDTTPTWAFSGEAGTSFTCQLMRGTDVVAALGACTSPVTYELSSEPDGTYTFSVTQTDAAANTSAPTSDDYTLDRAAPPAPVLTPPSPSLGPPPSSSAAPASSGGAVRSPAALTPAAEPLLEVRSRLAPPLGDAQSGPGVEDSSVRKPSPTTATGVAPGRREAFPATDTGVARFSSADRGASPPDGSIVARTLVALAEKTAFPLVLVLIVMIFLGVQDRIDRNDPKLAQVPNRVGDLEFKEV